MLSAKYMHVDLYWKKKTNKQTEHLFLGKSCYLEDNFRLIKHRY